jgi:Cu/Ag efflux pump CusA
MWSLGTAPISERIAAPMIGGLVTSFLMELLVYPPSSSGRRGKSATRTPSTAIAA